MTIKNILFALLLLVSLPCEAQTGKGADLKITFGKLPTNVTTTIDEVLSEPRFVSTENGSEVVSFTFSVIPSKGDMVWPFEVEGKEFTTRIIDLLKNHMQGQKGRIFLDEVKVKRKDGKIIPIGSFFITFTR